MKDLRYIREQEANKPVNMLVCATNYQVSQADIKI